MTSPARATELPLGGRAWPAARRAAGAGLTWAIAALLLAALPAAAPGAKLGGGDPVPTVPTRWGADYFPNVTLKAHDGRTLHFFDDLIRDKVVVINFIYTSCPDACPLETAKLTEVHSLLGDRVGQDVFMYSISIDPEHDTPEVLRDYSERFQTGPGWLFLTGDAADIKLLRQKLGMLSATREEDGKLSDHTLTLLIGNQTTGQWMKRSAMENPYLLATQLGSWLHNWKLPPQPGLDYADAPELRSITRGESLFRTRCSACHVIGTNDGILRQGPDLLGVTERRERAWLSRWLAEPDVMLAEKDPLAVELFNAYRSVPMPNMRLSPLEVEALLEFMADESQRVLSEEETPAAVDAAAEAPEEELPPCCQKERMLTELDGVADPAVVAWANEARPEPPLALEPELESPESPQSMGTAPAPEAGLPKASLLLCAGLVVALGLFAKLAAGR